METESFVEMKTEVVLVEVAEARGLADLVTATGDQELTSRLKGAAERITLEAESQAQVLQEQASSLRAEAARAFAAVTEVVRKAEEDARLSALAAEQVTDEALQRHLEQIAAGDQARLNEGLEWLERAQTRAEAANEEARALEVEADAASRQAQSRPEVIAWRQLTAPFMERMKGARSRRAVSEVLQDAESQGLADEKLRQASASRTRQLGELAWHTRETVKLWARYAPGGGRMFPAVTHHGAVLLAAAGPGTIFEVSAEGRKVAVHLSEDGFSWVRRPSAGPFRAHGALVRRFDGQARSGHADAR